MSYQVRIAQEKDVTDLVELMNEFYKEVGSFFHKEQSRQAFKKLISEDKYGRVWIFEKDDNPIGYMVLTVGFSMEYGGKDAFLDDLFIKESFRGAGLGKEALEIFFKECRMLDVYAVHVEVGPGNIHAKKLYERSGFKDNKRQLFSCRLIEPPEAT